MTELIMETFHFIPDFSHCLRTMSKRTIKKQFRKCKVCYYCYCSHNNLVVISITLIFF